MPATVQITEMTSGIAGVDKTGVTVRFKSADETTVDGSNPVQIPAAGTQYSFTKLLQLNLVSLDTSSQIDNLRAYSDGSKNWEAPVGCQYTVIGAFTSNIDTNIAGTDFFLSTQGSPIDMDNINNGPFTGLGFVGDLLRLQLTVGATANPGSLATEPCTFAYDEQ